MKLQSFLVVVLSLAMAGTVSAQFDPLGGPMGPGPGGGGGARGGQQNQLKQLQTQLSEEQAELKRIEEELERDFQQEPEWQDADAALKQAQADHDAAREAVLSKVYETAEYKALLEAKFAAETELDELTAAGDPKPEERQAASDKLMEASSAVRKMEDEALAADPQVAETKKKLADATAAVNALKKEFRESLELNEGYLTQSDRVEDVKFKLADARQRQQEQSRRQSETRSRQNETRSRNTNRNRGGGGGGGAPRGGMGGGY